MHPTRALVWRTFVRAIGVLTLAAASGVPAAAQQPTPSQSDSVSRAGEAADVSPAADSARKLVGDEVERRMKAQWQVGLNPQGGGLFVRSPDGKVYFRLYGYAQPQLTGTDAENRQAYRNVDFRVRRARIDFSIDYDDRYKLFVEFDGAPADGTALVEGYAQAAYAKGKHFVRFGKYITPFSAENLRSSRALETVERYVALNAMFGLPALDVQFGPMLFGTVGTGDRKLTYYAGAFNGNASAGAQAVNGQRGNSRDNNKAKDLQARLDLQLGPKLKVGVAGDADDEPAQVLSLPSYSGLALISRPVAGSRRGVDADFRWGPASRFALSGEGLYQWFQDTDIKLRGGYVQAGYWLSGTEKDGGVQGLLRVERAELAGDAVEDATGSGFDARRLDAITAAANVWLNGATRVQLNGILEHSGGAGAGTTGTMTSGPADGLAREWRPTFLAQFQVKF